MPFPGEIGPTQDRRHSSSHVEKSQQRAERNPGECPAPPFGRRGRLCKRRAARRESLQAWMRTRRSGRSAVSEM
jgi:hypothetical protein